MRGRRPGFKLPEQGNTHIPKKGRSRPHVAMECREMGDYDAADSLTSGLRPFAKASAMGYLEIPRMFVFPASQISSTQRRV